MIGAPAPPLQPVDPFAIFAFSNKKAALMDRLFVMSNRSHRSRERLTVSYSAAVFAASFSAFALSRASAAT